VYCVHKYGRIIWRPWSRFCADDLKDYLDLCGLVVGDGLTESSKTTGYGLQLVGCSLAGQRVELTLTA